MKPSVRGSSVEGLRRELKDLRRSVDDVRRDQSWKFDADELYVEPGADTFLDQLVKTTTDTPDDEFATSTLNPKWTAVAGSTGTVDLVGSGAGIYDLSSRPGWLLVQAKNIGAVNLRQDYTLPDGSSIIAATANGFLSDGGVVDYETFSIVALNDNDSAPDAGNYIYIGNVALAASLIRVEIGYNGTSWTTPVTASQKFFLRIARVGLIYYPFVSHDGSTWTSFGGVSRPTPMTNLWLWNGGSSAIGSPTPIQAFNWIRQGTNAVDPW